MDGFLLGRRGGHRPNRAGRTRDPSRHVPPASMALSPPHSTPQHPAARAHTFGLTVHDELNHTSRTPALCVRIQAPSRHMTKHRSGGIPSPFTKGTGIHVLASPWSPTSGEPHSLPPLQTKAGPRLREGHVTSPSPSQPPQTRSALQRERWSANICSPGIGPSRRGERRWILHLRHMTANGSSTPAPHASDSLRNPAGSGGGGGREEPLGHHTTTSPGGRHCRTSAKRPHQDSEPDQVVTTHLPMSQHASV